MKELTETSLAATMTRCNSCERYDAIIVFRTKRAADNFLGEIAAYHLKTPLPGVADIYASHNMSQINFTNGSRLEVVGISESLRGRKCNEVLYESAVADQRIFLDVVRHLEVPYKTYINGVWEADEKYELHQSEELNGFLSSFTIADRQ